MFMFIILTIVLPAMEFLLLAARGVVNYAKPEIALKLARYCRIYAEWCHSFTCIDVLLLVALVTCTDLRTAVEFNLGDECAAFKSIMGSKSKLSLVGLGFASSEECFLPVSYIRPGFFVMMLSSVLRFLSWHTLH